MKTEKTSTLIERLKIFIGEWNVEISRMSFRANKFETVTGLISFEWLDHETFITVHSEFSDNDFPSGIEVIGVDETNEKCSALYSDSREEY